MTTPWQELTLCGGWARAQIPRPIEHGVEAPSATPSASLSTSKIRITVERTGGSSLIEVTARTIDGSVLAGTQEGSPLHTCFVGPLEGSGRTPLWYISIRLCEQLSWTMPPIASLD